VPKQLIPSSPLANLIVTTQSEPDHFDPHSFHSIEGFNAMLNQVDTLVEYEITEKVDEGLIDAPFSNKPSPLLLESWEVLDGGRRYRFVIRDGIVFNTGNPMRVEDVVWTLQRGLKIGFMPTLMRLGRVTKPEQIKKVDTKTFEVLPDGPVPEVFMIGLLNMPLSGVLDYEYIKKEVPAAAATAEPARWAEDFVRKNPAGGGPYTLKEWKPGNQYVLTARQDYWKMRPSNDQVTVKVVPNPEDRVLLLERGDVDIAWGLPRKAVKERLADAEGVTVQNFPSVNCVWIPLNVEVKPLDNVTFRQALSYAVPYQTIIDEVLFGFGQQLKSPVPNGMPTHDPSAFVYETNLDKARELMKEAGVDSATLDISVRQLVDDDNQIAVWLQQSFKEIGVTLNINKLTDSVYQSQLAAREHTMSVQNWISWVNDAYYHLTWLAKTEPKKGEGATFNNYSNPTVDKLIDEGLYEIDPAIREQKSKEAQRIVVEEASWLFLFQPDYLVSMRSDVKGFTRYEDEQFRYHLMYKA
jgi:peptide/nickel transport system substrate-binding protein